MCLVKFPRELKISFGSFVANLLSFLIPCLIIIKIGPFEIYVCVKMCERIFVHAEEVTCRENDLSFVEVNFTNDPSLLLQFLHKWHPCNFCNFPLSKHDLSFAISATIFC